MSKQPSMAEIEARDPERAARMREYARKKQQRRRAANPGKERARERELYAINRERLLLRKKRWREKNPEAWKAIKVRYKLESRAKYIVQSVRSEARQKGVRFDISEAWVQTRLDRGVCELSGMAFDLDGELKNRPSVDRIIPGGDYVEDNCRLVLFGLNSLLKTKDEASAVARLYELRG